MNVPVGKERVWPSGQSRNPARDTTRKMDTQIWTFDDANTYWRQYDTQQYEIQHNESNLVYDHTQVKRPYMFGRLDEVEWRMVGSRINIDIYARVEEEYRLPGTKYR